MAAATVGASPGAHAQSGRASFSGSSQFFRCSISFSPAHAGPARPVETCLYAVPDHVWTLERWASCGMRFHDLSSPDCFTCSWSLYPMTS